MAKEYLNVAVLPVRENTHEIDKHCVRANVNGSDVVMKYQAQL